MLKCEGSGFRRVAFVLNLPSPKTEGLGHLQACGSGGAQAWPTACLPPASLACLGQSSTAADIYRVLGCLWLAERGTEEFAELVCKCVIVGTCVDMCECVAV